VSKSVRKISVLLGAAALIVFLISALPAAAAAHRLDKDCDNFNSQKAAQIFFINHGGPRYDPDDLDGDDDGVACEDNPCPCFYKDHLPRRYSASPAAGAPQPLKACSAYSKEHFHGVTAHLPDGTKCLQSGETCSHGPGFASAYREYGFKCKPDGRLEEV
jgi:hypothetical protein